MKYTQALCLVNKSVPSQNMYSPWLSHLWTEGKAHIILAFLMKRAALDSPASHILRPRRFPIFSANPSSILIRSPFLITPNSLE